MTTFEARICCCSARTYGSRNETYQYGFCRTRGRVLGASHYLKDVRDGYSFASSTMMCKFQFWISLQVMNRLQSSLINQDKRKRNQSKKDQLEMRPDSAAPCRQVYTAVWLIPSTCHSMYARHRKKKFWRRRTR